MTAGIEGLRKLSAVFAVLCALVAAASAAGFAEGAKAPASDPDSVLAHVNARVLGKSQFANEWAYLNPTLRPPGDALTARRAFLEQLVDRMLIGDAALAHHYAWTPAESLDYKKFNRRVLQNEYFDDIIGSRVEVDLSPEAIDLYKSRMTTIPLLRIFRFPDYEQARTWRQRLATGTPVSRLEALAAGGTEGVRIDTLGFVAWEQLPDTMRIPVFKAKLGQYTEALSVDGGGAFLQIMRQRVRPSITVANNDVDEIRATLRNEAVNRARDAYRKRLHEELAVQYDDVNSQFLLDQFLKLPPRVVYEGDQPTVNTNLPAPKISAEDGRRVLVRYRTGQMTVGEFVQWYTQLESTQRDEIRTRQMLEIVVDRPLFDNEIARRAEAGHYENRPRVLNDLAFRREGYAVQHYYENEIIARVPMGSDSLHAFFNRNPGRWNSPASLDAHIILVESKVLADSLVTALKAGGDFAKAAAAWSIHESAERQGALGTIYQGQQPDSAMDHLLFDAPPDQVVGPVHVQAGYLILRVTKKTPPVTRDFDEALQYVTNDYRVETSEAILKARLAELRKKAAPRVYPERVTADLGVD